MAKSKIPSEVRSEVEKRAYFRCEYCKAPANFSPHPFTMDHIIPIKRNGSDDLENLAYACFGCNRFKFDKTHGVDPLTRTVVSIFNPRQENWETHFAWDENYLRLLGLTPTGRATVKALELNRSSLVRMRKELIEVDRQPPK